MTQPPSGLTRRELLRRSALVAGALAAGGVPASATGTAVAIPGAAGAGGGLLLQLARVWPSPSTTWLVDALDETHMVFEDGSLEVLLWPGDRARLDAAAVRYEITVDDLIARDTAEAAAAVGQRSSVAVQPGERADYRLLPDFEADIDALVAAHPGRARKFSLPHRTHEDRTVVGIEIASDVARNDGRPVFYMDGVHHAREWPSAEYPIMWAHDLLESYATDARIRTVVDNVRTIIVPVMNPDGFHHSRTAVPDVQGAGNAITGNAYWRKNRRNDKTSPLEAVRPGYSAHGVDPNRNYTYAWGGAGASGTTSSDTYRGPGPLSEPETMNVAHVLRTNHAAGMITNHTSGKLVLWAWSWTLDDLEEQTLVEGLGRTIAALNGYTPQKSIDLYIHTGVCVDYAYGTFSTISYTFEHESSFHPAYASTIPAGYAKNRPAYLMLTEEACLPPGLRPADAERTTALSAVGLDPAALRHAVVSGRLVDASGAPVAGTVRLTKSLATPLWFDGDGANPVGLSGVDEVIDTVIDTDAQGRFEYHVNPSTRHVARRNGLTEAYTATFAAAGAGSATRSLVVERGEVVDLGAVVLG